MERTGGSDTTLISVRVKNDLWKRVRILAVEQEVSVQSVVRAALEKWVVSMDKPSRVGLEVSQPDNAIQPPVKAAFSPESSATVTKREPTYDELLRSRVKQKGQK